MLDEEYIKAYKDTGDVKHLSELYKPYMSLIYGTCLKYFKNTADAEDAVMDIFEKISKKVLTSNIMSFRAWIYMVSKNHCLEVLRKRNRSKGKENEAAVMYSSDVFHPDNVNDDIKIKILKECLERLEDFQKDCIKMFYYRKMSYIEIAEALDIAYNQVRSRIQNGRRNLRQCMDESKVMDSGL